MPTDEFDDKARTRAEPLPEEASVHVPGEDRCAEAGVILRESEDRLAEVTSADRPGEAADEHRRSEDTV